jgi:hypothetical protein
MAASTLKYEGVPKTAIPTLKGKRLGIGPVDFGFGGCEGGGCLEGGGVVGDGVCGGGLGGNRGN